MSNDPQVILRMWYHDLPTLDDRRMVTFATLQGLQSLFAAALQRAFASHVDRGADRASWRAWRATSVAAYAVAETRRTELVADRLAIADILDELRVQRDFSWGATWEMRRTKDPRQALTSACRALERVLEWRWQGGTLWYFVEAAFEFPMMAEFSPVHGIADFCGLAVSIPPMCDSEDEYFGSARQLEQEAMMSSLSRFLLRLDRGQYVGLRASSSSSEEDASSSQLAPGSASAQLSIAQLASGSG
jgi:hypothetical protein